MAKETSKVTMPTRIPSARVTTDKLHGAERGASASVDVRTTVNDSVTSLRYGDLNSHIRESVDRIGIVSHAIFSIVEIAHSSFKVKAYNTETTLFDVNGSVLAEKIIAGLDTVRDYSVGFSDKDTFATVVAQALLEVALTGATVVELGIDKLMLPQGLYVIPYEQCKKVRGSKNTYLEQTPPAGGDPIPLNYPTIACSELHRQAARSYVGSMYSAAVNDTQAYNEFVQEMRRAVRRAGHSRPVLTVDYEVALASTPDEIKADPKKLQAYLDGILEDLKNRVNALNPEDALVIFDLCALDTTKTSGEKADYLPLIEAMSGQSATSLKSSPSMLGIRSQGSQSLSNTESLIYLKTAKSIQRPVEDVLSRLLTLACRLQGVDVYVEFKFDPINLRPEDELEAFKVMQQDRVLTLLSLGFISDEEAGWELGTGIRPPGAPKLSGTMFKETKSVKASDASPNSDPQGRALQPNTPSKAGGKSQ